MTTTLTKTDVSSLITPTQVSVPDSIDDATSLLDDVGGLLSAGHWGTAAVVWAFTEDQQGSNQHRVKVHDALGINEFAALEIRGLKSNKSVAKYRQAWQHAIDEGWAKPAEPGKTCVLPDQAFEVPKIEPGPEKPAKEFNLSVAEDKAMAAIKSCFRDWPDGARTAIPSVLRGLSDEYLHQLGGTVIIRTISLLKGEEVSRMSLSDRLSFVREEIDPIALAWPNDELDELSKLLASLSRGVMGYARHDDAPTDDGAGGDNG